MKMRPGQTCLLLAVAIGCAARQPSSALDANSPPAFRLPGDVRPSAYALELTVRPGEPRFAGSVRIDVELKAPTRTIWLHGRELDVRSATVGEQKAAVRTAPPSWIGLDLGHEVGPGRTVIGIDYEGAINRDVARDVFQAELDGAWYAFSNLEPHYARRMVPCFDEPAFKVPWTLTLRVLEGLVAASNTGIASEAPVGSGMKLVRFQPTKPLPSYLVAFAVGPFDVVDAGVAGRARTPIRLLIPRGQAAQASYGTRVVPKIIDHLERFLDLPFPYEKLDVVAVPALGGAMENAGLVTINMTWILALEENGTFREGAAGMMAHEIAHQWFGDLVTPGWWDDIWLNESLASLAGHGVKREIEPLVANPPRVTRRDALALDLDRTVKAVHRRVTDEDELTEAIDSVVYDKGEMLLDMVEGWLGQESLRRGLRDYLTAHAGGNATTDDFLAALSKASGREVGAVVRSFIEQPGIPLVQGTLSCEGSEARLHLSQSRFPAVFGTGRWAIPVCVRLPEKTDCFVLDRAEATRRLPPPAKAPRAEHLRVAGAQRAQAVNRPQGGPSDSQVAMLGAWNLRSSMH